jgi:hypothetical protein
MDSSTGTRNCACSSSNHSDALSIGENERRRTEERKHEALVTVRLVSEDGDVIWSATAESLGGTFLGASADVADKIAKRLAKRPSSRLGSWPPDRARSRRHPARNQRNSKHHFLRTTSAAIKWPSLASDFQSTLVLSLCSLAYFALPLAEVLVFLLFLRGHRMDANLPGLFAVASVAGFLFYQVCPATGPVHVFGAVFPPSGPNFVPSQAIPLADIPCNAIPAWLASPCWRHWGRESTT